MYEYGDIEDIKPGDIVEHQGKARNDIFGSDKKLCIVTEARDDIIYTNVKPNAWFNKEYFKLVKTRPGTEAKVGDTVIFIKEDSTTPKHTPGQLGIVNSTAFNGIWIYNIEKDKPIGHYCDSQLSEFVVLCKAKPVSKNPFKKGDKVISLTHGGLLRKAGSEHTVYKVSKDEVYYNDGFSTHYENFKLVEPECTEKRNLAFYKRSGKPWTNEECENIIKYVESPVQIKTEDWGNLNPTSKYMYDAGLTISYMANWVIQEKYPNFKNCKQVAYEDMFDAPYPKENIDIFVPVDKIPISPATSCSQSTPTIPEEEPVNEIITISMTVKEYAKLEKQVKQTKPMSDLELEYKKPFSAKVFNEDGKYLSKLFAKSQKKLDAAISEHLHRNRFDIIVDSTTHKTSKAARAEVVQS